MNIPNPTKNLLFSPLAFYAAGYVIETKAFRVYKEWLISRWIGLPHVKFISPPSAQTHALY